MTALASEIPTGWAALRQLPLVDAVPLVGLPALWVLLCLFYCLRAALVGMPRTERIDKVSQSPYLPRVVMEFGYWMFSGPVALCLRLGITPNMITIGSLAVCVAGAAELAVGHFSLGGWLLFVAFMMDAWDGMVARRLGSSSVSGEFLDASIDRYADAVAILGLLYYYRDDLWPWLFGAATLVGATLVSYTRAKGESVGVDPNVGYMQRHERAVYLGTACVFTPILNAWVEPGAVHPRNYLVIVILALMAVATNVTAVMRMRFVQRGLARRTQEVPRLVPSLPPGAGPSDAGAAGEKKELNSRAALAVETAR